MKRKILILIGFILINNWYIKAQDGSIDPLFNIEDQGFGNYDGANGTVNAIGLQSNGKIIIGGNFTTFNGANVRYLARLNVDGSLDSSFSFHGPYTLGLNTKIYAIKIQNDDKIIIGGNEDIGLTNSGIIRLNPNGDIDFTFSGVVGGALGHTVNAIAIQNDGKIIVGGYILNNIRRLNSDGSIDNTFNVGTGTDFAVDAIAIQDNGKIIIGGKFSSFNGVPRDRLARLNSDGYLDPTFTPCAWTHLSFGIYWNYAIAIQNDGKIIIGGYFNSYNGIGKNRVARIMSHTGTGLNDFPNHDNILVYPVPFTNELIIEIEGNNEDLKYEIYNMLGQVVCIGTVVDKVSVQTKQLPTGIYVIKLENKMSYKVCKIANK